jgi:sulfur carrier protein
LKVIVNGTEREIDAGSNVAELLAELGLEAGSVALEVNRELLPRSEYDAHELHEGDRLEIVTLVGGG